MQNWQNWIYLFSLLMKEVVQNIIVFMPQTLLLSSVLKDIVIFHLINTVYKWLIPSCLLLRELPFFILNNSLTNALRFDPVLFFLYKAKLTFFFFYERIIFSSWYLPCFLKQFYSLSNFFNYMILSEGLTVLQRRST